MIENAMLDRRGKCIIQATPLTLAYPLCLPRAREATGLLRTGCAGPKSAVSRRRQYRACHVKVLPRAASVTGNLRRSNADATGAMSSWVASPPILCLIVREIVLAHETYSLAGVRPVPACSGRSRWRGADAARGLPSHASGSDCSLVLVAPGPGASFPPKHSHRPALASPPHGMASDGRSAARRRFQQVWGRNRGANGHEFAVRLSDGEAGGRRSASLSMG